MNWKFWKKREPIDDIHELLELVIKAARRCAYDLSHAADMIDKSGWRGEYSDTFKNLSKNYLIIFNPGDDGKSYRAQLHYEMNRLEYQLEHARRYCEKHGLNPMEVLDDPPF